MVDTPQYFIIKILNVLIIIFYYYIKANNFLSFDYNLSLYLFSFLQIKIVNITIIQYIEKRN